MLSNDEDDSSSCDSSIEEISESDIEDDPNSDYTAFSAKYMGEITNLLGNYSHVNCDNALILNKEMQQRLQEVRKRLQALLQAVKQRYLSNEQRLKLNLGKKQRGIGMRGAYLKGGTFFFKGNMFFKDIQCRNCPNNSDYEKRKNEGEIFPMDFELSSRHVWSLQDKRAVVQAVKEQVIDYLADRSFRDKNKSKQLELQIKVHTEKLTCLLSKADDNFQIDWEEVSAHNLNYRHSPSSCKTMWQVYLQPSLKRSSWTAEENKRLLQAAQMHNYQNWESIAKAVPKRSDYQCFIQYQTSVCFNDTQRWGRWDKRDDARLLELVQKKTMNGIINWNIIASYFPHKPKKSLHQRYMYYLDPKISHEPFTPEEDLILLAAVEEYGEKFALLPRTLFPNRSIAQLRMRYKYTLKTRHKLAPWSVEDDKKLMGFVTEHGTSSWLRCAELLGNHNRISCRTRFLTIQKFFAKNPDTTLEDIPRKKTCIIRNSVITPQNWVEKVAELRENPDTVLVPTAIKQRKAEIRLEKAKAKAELKALQIKEPLKCNVKIPGSAVRKKAPYIERLRAVEQKLYHFFKYAYNFRLGTDVCTKPPNATLCEVSASLSFQADTAKQYNPDSMLSSYIGRRCKFYLQQEHKTTNGGNVGNQFASILPPSWSTALAFRALCIQSAHVQSEDTENDKQIDDYTLSPVNEHVAVQRFRKRMIALFFQTALLSRLEPARFNNLMENTSSVPTNKVTTNTKIVEEFTLDTTTSAYENEPQQQLFDLSCVKNEYPSEYLSNNKDDIVEVNETLPRVEIAKQEHIAGKDVKKKEKKNKRITNPNGTARKRKLQKSTSTAAETASLLTVNSTATEVTIHKKLLLQHDGSPVNQSALNTTCIKQEYHITPQPETNISTARENLPLTCLSNTQKKKARKSKLLINSPSGEEPTEKRVCIDAQLKLTDIKTEFEI